VALQGVGGKGFAVVGSATMRPRAPMRPHSWYRQQARQANASQPRMAYAAEKIGLHVEPIEAVHVARRIDAAKMHGGHGASLEIVQRLTL